MFKLNVFFLCFFLLILNSVTEVKGYFESGTIGTEPVRKEFYKTSDNYGNPSIEYDYSTNWGYRSLNVDERLTGAGVKIAIMDSGILNTDEIKVEEQISCDSFFASFCNTSNEIKDGHGTAVASIIKLPRENKNDVSGVAPSSKIYSIKYCSDYEDFDAYYNSNIYDCNRTTNYSRSFKMGKRERDRCFEYEFYLWRN